MLLISVHCTWFWCVAPDLGTIASKYRCIAPYNHGGLANRLNQEQRTQYDLGARHFISALHLTLISEEQVHRSLSCGGLANRLNQEQRTRREVGCVALY